MTDNEIIKALMYHADTDIKTCKICPYDGVKLCGHKLCSDALDLINRQKSEIERLTINMNAFGLGMIREKERVDTARAEAIREFAERVKARSMATHKGSDGSYSYEINNDFIDKLVKEMAGDNNG